MKLAVRIAERFEKVWAEQAARYAKRDAALRAACFTSTPVKSALYEYINHRNLQPETTQAKLCGDHISTSLKTAGAAFASRPHALQDYKHVDMSIGWEHLKADLVEFINSGQYLPPEHIADMIKGLNDIGFKDQQIMGRLIELMVEREKFDDPLEESFTQIMAIPEESLHDAILKVESIVADATDIADELQQSVASIRAQYGRIIARQQRSLMIQQKYSLREAIYRVQDNLVKSGLASAQDFDEISSFYDQERAKQVFDNIVDQSFPSLNVLREYQTYYEFGELWNPYDFSTHNLGRLFSAIGDAMRVDRNQSWYNFAPNPVWETMGKDHLHDSLNTGGHMLTIAPECTRLWHDMRALLKKVEGKIPVVGGNATDLCLLAYGASRCRVGDQSVYAQICQHLSEPDLELKSCLGNDLAKGMYGIALSGYAKGAEAVGKLAQVVDHTPLSASALMHAVWGMCYYQLYDMPEFADLLEQLNDISFPNGYLSNEETEILNEIYWSVRLETKFNPSASFVSINIGADNSRIHPIKDILSKDLWALADPDLSIEERREQHKQFMAKADAGQTIYQPDSMLVYNGKIVYVFLQYLDGIANDTTEPMGNMKLRVRHLQALGEQGLVLDAEKMANIDSTAPSLEFAETNYILDRLTETCGPPVTVLDQLDAFASKMLKQAKRRFLSEQDTDFDLWEIISRIQLLYKMQSRLRHQLSGEQQAAYLTAMQEELARLKDAYNSYNDKEWLDAISAQVGTHDTFGAVLAQVQLTDPHGLEVKTPWWAGVRQGVEILDAAAKDITPELINQDFLWIEDYHHYSDWQQKMTKFYPLAVDMEMTAHPLDNRYYFGKRRQTYGITPNPALEKNSLGNMIPPSGRMMACLQNLKYELKRNHTDAEILDKILSLETLSNLASELAGVSGEESKTDGRSGK